MKDMKVYRLNDCDFVAAESFEQAKKWYMNETGLSEEEALDPAWEPFNEIDIDKGTMWAPVDYLPDDEKTKAREMKSIDGILMTLMPYRRVIEIESKGEPFIIASTEY